MLQFLVVAIAAPVQAPGVVDLDPTLPPSATWPQFANLTGSVAGPGTLFGDKGTGRAVAWVDVVGPDPANPHDPMGVGPPDGLHDLIVANSNSPELPLGATAAEWVTPPIGPFASACAVLRQSQGVFHGVAGAMSPAHPAGFSVEYPGGSPWGVVAGDYDGDGFEDLFYSCGGFNVDSPNALLRAMGDGTFENRSLEAGVTQVQYSFTGVWLDADVDGDLDLFVGNGHPDTAPYLAVGDPNPDVSDRLHRNLGDGTFEEIGAEAGVDLKSSTFAATASDLDRDGVLDLVMSCFLQYNKVYYGQGDGTYAFMVPPGSPPLPQGMATLFPDPHFPGTEDFGFVPPLAKEQLPVMGIRSMPVETQDFNGDGWIDIVFASWSTQLPDSNPSSALGGQFLPHDRAFLYLNLGDQDGDGRGDGVFRECALDVGLSHVGGAMGMTAGDFDGNGFMDLHIGCGGPLLGAHFEEDYYFVNDGTLWPDDFLHDPGQALQRTMFEVGALTGSYNNISMSHGVTSRLDPATGRLDLLVANGGPAAFGAGQANLYLAHGGNADGTAPSYVEVDLVPDLSPPGVPGARVELVRDHGGGAGQVLVRERHAGLGFSSQNFAPLRFAFQPDAPALLSVSWPSGVRHGELLADWTPGATASPVTLVEPRTSVSLTQRRPVSGQVVFDLAVENFDASAITGNLIVFSMYPSGAGGWTAGFILPMLQGLSLSPQESFSLSFDVGDLLPSGVYAALFVDTASGNAVLNGSW